MSRSPALSLATELLSDIARHFSTPGAGGTLAKEPGCWVPELPSRALSVSAQGEGALRADTQKQVSPAVVV